MLGTFGYQLQLVLKGGQYEQLYKQGFCEWSGCQSLAMVPLTLEHKRFASINPNAWARVYKNHILKLFSLCGQTGLRCVGCHICVFWWRNISWALEKILFRRSFWIFELVENSVINFKHTGVLIIIFKDFGRCHQHLGNVNYAVSSLIFHGILLYFCAHMFRWMSFGK